MKEREAKMPKDSLVLLIQAVERLVQLYDVTGKNEEAAKWRKTLEDQKKEAEKKP